MWFGTLQQLQMISGDHDSTFSNSQMNTANNYDNFLCQATLNETESGWVKRQITCGVHKLVM